MIEDPVVQVAGLVVAALAANWLGDRFRLPAILPLLGMGLAAGPWLGVFDPAGLLGGLLDPVVGLAVGVILFEGGLSLRLSEVVDGEHRVIWKLVSVGAAVTWVIGALASWLLLDVGLAVAILIGAILIVSGPTVIGPVLQAVRPSRKVGSILKWESILVDPIGALAAVITFDVVIAGADRSGAGAVFQVVAFLVVGATIGLAVGWAATFALRRHWVPEHLISLFGLACALAVYAAADLVVHESGLLATIVLGLVLANFNRVGTEALVRFSEVLRVLLIGVLFIVLSARLTRDQLLALGWGTVGVVAVLTLLARPLATWLSTRGSGLSRREVTLLAGVAPRGIVAASVASVFGAEVEEAGLAGAELLVPIVFAVIIATVLVYGLGAGPLARALDLAPRSQEGVLLLGGGRVERALAQALSDAGIYVLIATVNARDARKARSQGLAVYHGNVLSLEVDYRLELSGIGRLMAMTPNDDVNTLAARRFQEAFGGGEVYQIPATRPAKDVAPVELGGRPLFAPDLTYERLDRAMKDEEIRRSSVGGDSSGSWFESAHGRDAVALAVVRQGRLLVGAVDAPTPLVERLQPGDEVLWLPVVWAPERKNRQDSTSSS